MPGHPARGLLRRSAVLVMAAGLAAGGTPLVGTAASTAPAATTYPNVDVGTAAASATVSSPSTGGAKPPDRGARRLHTGRVGLARTAAGQMPVAVASPLSRRSNATVLENFNGVSSLDSAVTNFGAQFEPPDQGLCVGNGFVLEPVNSAYRIYRRDGSTIAGPFNVNDLFHEGPREFTSDPRCYFDRQTNTWFAVILFIKTNPDGSFGDASHLDVSVNPSGDPTTAWTTYRIDTTDLDPNKVGCPCFGDQPLLGVDRFNLYLSTNEFSILGPQFYGAQIYALARRDLEAGARTIHFVRFKDLTIAGDLATSVQPAITIGDAEAEFFLNSLDPTGTVDNRVGVWAMTNTAAVARGKTPTLSSEVITSERYGVPPNAVQQGSAAPLNTGDDRMQQVQYIGGHLWGALSTTLIIPGDTADRSAAAWFDVQPQLEGNRIGSAELSQQGYVAVPGNYLLYPALQANENGDAAMVVTLSGADHFASAALTVLRGGHSAFDPVTVAAAGTGPYDPDAGRWGDYSWVQLDPEDGTFWMATEYMPSKSSQTTDGDNNWGTRVLEVKIRG